MKGSETFLSTSPIPIRSHANLMSLSSSSSCICSSLSRVLTLYDSLFSLFQGLYLTQRFLAPPARIHSWPEPPPWSKTVSVQLRTGFLALLWFACWCFWHTLVRWQVPVGTGDIGWNKLRKCRNGGYNSSEPYTCRHQCFDYKVGQSKIRHKSGTVTVAGQDSPLFLS